MIWPNFYFEPVQAGKNLWLALQGISILVFVVGLFLCGRRRAPGLERPSDETRTLASEPAVAGQTLADRRVARGNRGRSKSGSTRACR